MALRYVLATVPALAAYNDGQGARSDDLLPNNGASLPVSAGPSGDVVLTINVLATAAQADAGREGYGKAGSWTDIGGLQYKPKTENLGFDCP